MANKLIALIKREVLEHNNLWRVPLILIGVGILVKLSLSIGNLSLDLELPNQLNFDDTIDDVLDGVIAKSLDSMNSIIALVMFVVAVFYALSCLYEERQDDSVLFWRSLPVSDSLTIASKLLVALVLIPVVIVLCQAVMAVVFFGLDSFTYLASYYSTSLLTLGKILLWSMLPTIAWCALCSEVASRNPFLLAFIAPFLLILVDKLFFNGAISQTFVINRFWGVKNYTLVPLISGIIFAAVCFLLTVMKRSQRV